MSLLKEEYIEQMHSIAKRARHTEKIIKQRNEKIELEQ